MERGTGARCRRRGDGGGTRCRRCITLGTRCPPAGATGAMGATGVTAASRLAGLRQPGSSRSAQPELSPGNLLSPLSKSRLNCWKRGSRVSCALLVEDSNISSFLGAPRTTGRPGSWVPCPSCPAALNPRSGARTARRSCHESPLGLFPPGQHSRSADAVS